MAVRRVLVTPDRRWRAEQRRDGWQLTWDGFLVLQRATLDQVTMKMIDLGGDPETLEKG